MATKITVEFVKVRTAEQVVKDLKFAFEWSKAEYFVANGQPHVRFWTKDEDGKKVERERCLLALDEICDECSDGRNFDDYRFNDRFDYTFHIWGKDEKGNWVMGYED